LFQLQSTVTNDNVAVPTATFEEFEKSARYPFDIRIDLKESHWSCGGRICRHTPCSETDNAHLLTLPLTHHGHDITYRACTMKIREGLPRELRLRAFHTVNGVAMDERSQFVLSIFQDTLSPKEIPTGIHTLRVDVPREYYTIGRNEGQAD